MNMVYEKPSIKKSTSPSISRRIAVVGYGPDKPKPRISPNAAENRRVEIRLITNEKDWNK